QHAQLQRRVEVAEEEPVRAPGARVEARLEMLEDVELRVEGLRGVEVVPVAALPAERPTRHALQRIEVHAAGAQELELREREVVAHHAHDLHGDRKSTRLN